MNLELAVVILVILAILVTALVEVLYLGGILRGISDKMTADDAALYLQGKRVEEVVREMRAELLRR